MSSQTFDVTYRLRRPELEQAIFREIALGSSLRRVAQLLGINRKTVSRRLFRARHRMEQESAPERLARTQVAEPAASRFSGRKLV